MKRNAKIKPIIQPPPPLHVGELKGDEVDAQTLDSQTLDTMAQAVIARYPRVMAKLAQ